MPHPPQSIQETVRLFELYGYRKRKPLFHPPLFNMDLVTTKQAPFH